MTSSSSWSTPNEAYDWLVTHSRESANYESMAALLHWDQRTMIPPKGHEHRTEMLAQLAGLIHERAVDSRRGEALDKAAHLAEEVASTGAVAVNLREWRRDYERAVKIPHDLAVALAKAAAEAETVWEQARPKNDWQSFLPHLECLLRLKREEAEAVGYVEEPYDALLDAFEPDETARRLEPVFATLRTANTALLGRIKGARRKPDASLLRGEFPIEAQRDFALHAASALGYDLKAGRMDISAHPFSTTIGPKDSRITTRFNQQCFSEAFFSTIHETGHALYEQGLLAENWGTPMGQAVSLGVHESQSRLWENIVGRSRPFWKHFLPKARERFQALVGVSLEYFFRAVNEVRPGLIRVDADEVTYNLHVLLRFELELALFRGELEPADLPEAWNAKMLELLGLTPPDFSSGVMQDVHWSAGLFGYFPTYTLGNIMAAQLFAAAERDLGEQEGLFAKGNFKPLLQWLRERVHAHGRRFRPRDLIREATGEELDSGHLISYLEKKAATVYGL